MTRRALVGIVGFAASIICSAAPIAQTPALTGAQFDVVSIKPHPYDPAAGSGMRTLPDGTFMMTSQAIGSIVGAASPFQCRRAKSSVCPTGRSPMATTSLRSRHPDRTRRASSASR